MKGSILQLHPHPLPYSNLQLPTSPTLPITLQSHTNFKSEAMLLIHVRLPQASTVYMYCQEPHLSPFFMSGGHVSNSFLNP